ncbi:protein RETARDED ROOT GROWTH, mitochondrial-like [Oryza brachyantha]|uniref:protein RETARDED ROOT GROWTH, mitochondrial-like n=1 Tax=Oryza brachyantha TaxID=4533 RepID=UPI001ADC014E|nr:protein RETARDED ROOT GROWTH, mitochondrial-like [Oryza brachyantha]
MGRLRACSRLRRLLATRPPPPPARPPPTTSEPLPRLDAYSRFARAFSSASAAVAVAVPHEARDSGLGSSAYWAWIRAAAESAPAPPPQHEEEEEEEDDGLARCIPVKAYFLSTSIDLKSLQAEHGSDVVPPSTRSLNYIALRYSEFPQEIMDIGVKDSRFCYRFVVVFQYGSAVLFNIADHEAEHYLDIIRKHASGWLPEMRKDDYAVVEKPSLTTWMKGGLDYIVLKSLDTDGIRIISSVLGQSIALDHYIRQVDDMVEEFTEINRVMEKTGNFTMQRKKLFQLVGKANSNLADVIIRLGLFDRSEIAWKNSNYAQILEYLREEYELNQRFGSLDFKLKFVEHNIHFLQEVLQNRRSDLLEWGVIILLIIEIVISLYEIIKDSSMMS